MADTERVGRTVPRGRPVRRLTHRIRIGVIQLVCALGGALAAVVAVTVRWEPLFPETAVIPIMIGMAFSVVGLVTILFSLLFTVVQWVYGTFSLRLRRFEDRPLAWWVFGFAIGIFVYSLLAALLAARADEVSWIVPGITFLGALVGLVLMRRLQLDAFTSVQLGPTLVDLCSLGVTAVDLQYPAPFTATRDPVASADAATRGSVAPDGAGTAVCWTGPPRVVQAIDEDRLVDLAVAGDAVVTLTVGVGAFLGKGDVVGHVNGPRPVDVCRAVVTGTDRTTDDPLFVIRLVVDIALRALSPAVNDPATAVQAIDCLDVLLRRIASRDLAIGLLAGPDGSVVAAIPVPSWDEIVAEALDDLVICAAPLPLASRRLRRLLSDLTRATPPQRTAAVQARLESLEARLAR